MDDTVPDTSNTSESSSGNEEPRPSLSRQKQHRLLLRVGSAALLKRERLWRKRVTDRLKEAQRLKQPFTSGSSSEEEDAKSSAAHAAILQSSAQLTPAQLHGTHRKLDVLAALKSLPRPSEVVPELDAGSASDAGCDKELREAHKRRVKSTEVSILYLNRDGTQDLVPRWMLDRYGLKRYTGYMFPPPEDQNIKTYRVPLALLSRSYRGTFLKTHKIGAKRAKRKKQGVISNGGLNSSKTGAEVTHSDHGFIADLEYWATTTDSDVDGGCQSSKPPNVQSNSEQGELLNSNKELVEQLIAENDSGSSASEEGEKSSSIGSAPNSPPLASSVQKPPSPDQPEDHLSELFTMVNENRGPLFADDPKSEPIAVDSGKEEGKDGDDITVVVDGQNDAEQSLSRFEVEKSKGIDFCYKGDSLKRPRSSVQMEVLKLEPDKRKAKLTSLTDAGKAEAKDFDVSSKSMRMMEKMGFKGRLGANEDGILEPIKARSTQGRHGLGLRAERDVVMGKPIAKRPSSFKGKVTETVVLDGDVPTPRHEGPIDSYAMRKQRQVAITDGASDVKSGSRHGQQAKRVLNKALDEDDEFETEYEDSSVDNGRRAILIDVDVLMNNSRERRTNAFRKLVEDIEAFPKGFDVSMFLSQEKHDLCDAENISKILQAAGLDTSDAVTEQKLQNDLDDAFSKGDAPDWNLELIMVLKQYSREVYFGLLHMGSRTRLNHELSSLVTSHSFLSGSRVTVKHGDVWPYTATWQDLLCRTGVRARQAMFILPQQTVNDTLVAGMVAGSVLGARALAMNTAEQEVHVQMLGNDEGNEVKSAVIGKDHKGLFYDFLRKPRKAIKRRRVLALYAADGLWYAGLEQFAEPDGCAKGYGRSLIRFYGYGNQEWVENESVLSLTRRKFRKMRDAGFGGILDPGDVDDM